jgi:hypothetical protein
VIKMQAARVMERQEPHLEQLSSLQGLRRWRDAIVRFVEERHGAHGCEIGSLASELADRSEPARILINATFRSWESYLAAGLCRMHDRGELDVEPTWLNSPPGSWRHTRVATSSHKPDEARSRWRWRSISRSAMWRRSCHSGKAHPAQQADDSGSGTPSPSGH